MNLPRLLDCRALMAELGIKRAAAEALMRQLPKQRIPDCRRVYVRLEDVQRLLDENRRAA